MTSRGGFRWPESGPVSAPDWDPEPRCGGGLHGLLWGCGDGVLLDWSPDAKWLVVEVADRIVDLGGKVKFPRGCVVYCGDRKSATDYLLAHSPTDRATAVVGAFVTADYRGTATAGYHGTATAGNCGTATAGYHGTATAGYHGTATAGDRGTATAGDRGTATAGDCGTATAGDDGTATAGDRGEIRIRYHDGNRFRLAVGYVGEDGIEPNTPYVVKHGKLVKKEAA